MLLGLDEVPADPRVDDELVHGGGQPEVRVRVRARGRGRDRDSVGVWDRVRDRVRVRARARVGVAWQGAPAHEVQPKDGVASDGELTRGRAQPGGRAWEIWGRYGGDIGEIWGR